MKRGAQNTKTMAVDTGYLQALCPRLVGPLSTCRFQSRIDYFFLESSRFDRVLGLTHVDDDASDHNMVIIDV